MKGVCLFILFAGLCQSVSKASECTARGRFPNDDAEICRGYTMCLLGGANGYTQYKLTCPVGFVYSHLEQQCTNATNYQCLPNYNCNISGLFENPTSQNCSSYVACPQGLDGIVTARQIECPLNQVFSSIEMACVSNQEYSCSLSDKHETSDVTTEATLVIRDLSVDNVTDLLKDVSQHNVSILINGVSDGNEFQVLGSTSASSVFVIDVKYFLFLAAIMLINMN